jgi:hypothetical protein
LPLRGNGCTAQPSPLACLEPTSWQHHQDEEQQANQRTVELQRFLAVKPGIGELFAKAAYVVFTHD